MIRVIVTAMAAFAVLVVSYHHFASASSQSLGGPAGSTLPGGSTRTAVGGSADALNGLSASRSRHFRVEQAQWQAAFDQFTQATLQCPVQFAGVIGAHPQMGRCIAPAYRRWAASFGRFQRDVASDMRTVSGSCRSALAGSAGLTGAGAKLRASMRDLERDIVRSHGPGVPSGMISDTRAAVAAQGTIVRAALSVSSACR